MYSGFPEYGDLFDDHPDDHLIVMEEELLMPEVDWRTKEEHDKHIGAEVLLEVGGEKKQVIVKACARDSNSEPIGTRNDTQEKNLRKCSTQLELLRRILPVLVHTDLSIDFPILKKKSYIQPW